MVTNNFLRSKAFFMIYIIVFVMFSLYQSTPVKAVQQACCEKTVSGDYCVNTDEINCNPNFNKAYSNCATTTYCQPVCCINNQQGTCFSSVGLAQCRSNTNNLDNPSASCNSVNQCRQGCCKIGNQCSLGTEQQCNLRKAPFPSLANVDVWDEGTSTETACLNQCAAEITGCCMNLNSVCSVTTQATCSGQFNANQACSAVAQCHCTTHSSKRCGQDNDVYWYDSCGNKEDKAEDCTEGSTICNADNPNQVQCKSIDCATTYSDNKNVHDPKIGGPRKNGEKWCIYESPTGNFSDYPGSRHFMHYCFNGQEHVEPCRDFREQICLQGTINANGEDIGSANCINNNIYSSAVNENTSTVPIGSEFWKESTSDRCDRGTTECTMLWVKEDIFSDWDCEENCQCETQQWMDDAATFCKAQGDCGADLNTAQERSDSGLIVKWTGTHRGPRPREVSENYWNKWMTYGVFGGMKQLLDTYQSVIDAPSSDAGSYNMNWLYAGIGAAAAGWIVFGPWGAAVALLSLFGLGGDTAEKTVTVECKTWQAPSGGSNCGQCNSDPFKECSEYKCKSLGASCDLVESGPNAEQCVDMNPNDVNHPIITPWEEALSQGYGINNIPNGYAITPNIAVFTPISFGIKTDELAQCKIETNHKNNFNEMEMFFGDPYYRTEHNITLNLPGGNAYNYYVRCADKHGNFDYVEYTIRFTTSPEPDLTPPVIDHASIANNAPVTNGINSTPIALYVNEPSTCKWSGTDKAYDEMENPMVCDTQVNNNPAFMSYYQCLGSLTPIVNNQPNNFYFRCRDISPNHNTNQQSFRLILKGTNPLYITNSEPNGTLYVNSPMLRVITSAGSQNGKAVCTFSLNNQQPVQFFQTNSTLHQQQLVNLTLGDYNYFVRCVDNALNEANRSVSFNVNVDLQGPMLRYLYSDGTKLHLTTNEASTCEYSTNSFGYGSGTRMTGTNVTQHDLNINANLYYIICQDIYGNNGVMIRVYPH